MRGLAVNVAFKGILNPLSHAVSSIQPAQELRPEIGSSGADGSKQFRVAHPLTSDGESLSTRKD